MSNAENEVDRIDNLKKQLAKIDIGELDAKIDNLKKQLANAEKSIDDYEEELRYITDENEHWRRMYYDILSDYSELKSSINGES